MNLLVLGHESTLNDVGQPTGPIGDCQILARALEQHSAILLQKSSPAILRLKIFPSLLKP